MDIRGASADRIHQHLVDELHNRRIVVLAVDAAIAAGLVVAARDVEIVQAFGIVQIAQRIVGLHPQLHGALDGVLINEDGLYQQVGVELDFVEGSGVGRIGNTDKQAATTFEERQHMVFLQQLFFDQPDRALTRIHDRRIEQRHAELDRVGGGELRRRDQLLIAQIIRDWLALAGGGIQRLACDGLVQGTVQHQAPDNAGDADQIGSVSNIHFLLRLARADPCRSSTSDNNIETA